MPLGKTTSIRKAAIINAVSKYSTVIANLIFTVILARLLSPDDYGVMVVINVFVNFFSILADMGISTGVIQNKELTKSDIDGIFSFSTYLGVALMLLFCLLAYPISAFYKNPNLVSVCLLLSLSLLLTSWNMVPNALLLKDKQFSKVGLRNFVVPILSYGIAVFFAFLGAGYYALVAQSIMSAFSLFLWNFITSFKEYDLRPSLKFKATSINKIKRYSGFQFAFSLVNYFSRNLDNILVGKYMGSKQLGFYNQAYQLSVYPITMFANVISPVLHPILSDFQKDKHYIYLKYVSVLKVLSAVGCFIAPLCFIGSSEIIQIMYGTQWLAAIPCFQALSVSIWCQMMTSTAGSIFQAANNTFLMFKSAIINTVITVICIVAGVLTHSIYFTAILVAVAYLINFFITFFILIHQALDESYVRLLQQFLPDIAFVLVTCVGGKLLFNAGFFAAGNLIVPLLLKACFVGVLLLAFLGVSKRYKLLLRLVFRRNS